MTELTLSEKEISTLKRAHRAVKKKRDAYCISAIVRFDIGWTIREVAEALFLDNEAIKNYVNLKSSASQCVYFFGYLVISAMGDYHYLVF